MKIDYFNIIAGHPDPMRLNNFDIMKEDSFDITQNIILIKKIILFCYNYFRLS